MNSAQTDEFVEPKPLRLWPGVLAVVLQWLAWLVLPKVVPESTFYAMMGAVLGGGLAVVVWWLFFSRAPWWERVGAIVLMPIAVFAAWHIVHPSIAKGAMGMLLPVYAIPVLSLALVSWAVASRHLSRGLRRASMVATILLACGVFTLLRTGGMTGDGDSDFHWRWTPTPEERLVALANDEPKAPQSAPTAANPGAYWPGFRGPERDGIVRGVRIATDWSRSRLVELWRRPIGPGWSSFAVRGDLLYTQEQRGDAEVVSCYYLANGQPVWRHREEARFLGIERRSRSARHADPQQWSCLHMRRHRNRERAERG
jgi:hypothetical protein